MNAATLRRWWIAAVAFLVIAIVAGSLAPSPVESPGAHSDKYAHFVAYFALAVLGSGIASPERLWRVMLRCLLLGASLELAQGYLTDHRTADLGDLLANAAGIGAAWLLAGQGRAGWGFRAAAWLSDRRSS